MKKILFALAMLSLGACAGDSPPPVSDQPAASEPANAPSTSGNGQQSMSASEEPASREQLIETFDRMADSLRAEQGGS